MIRLVLAAILTASLILIMLAAAMMHRLAQIMGRIEDMPWEMIEIGDMLCDEEPARAEKPPDRCYPQARADDRYKTPMARRSSERLTRRRNEAMG